MKSEKLIKAIRVLVFLILLTPLIVVPKSFFPFIFWKVIAFRVLVEIALVIYLILVIEERQYLPSRSCLLWSVAVFFGVLIVTSLTSVNPYQSFWSNQERMEGLITMLHFGTLFFILGGTFSKKKDWYWFFKVSFAVSLLASFYGFLQKLDISWSWVIFGGASRLSSTIGNPAFFAAYLVPNIFLGTLLALRARTWRSRTFYILAIFFECLVLYWTATRGALLAMMAAVICLLFFGLGQRTQRSLKYIFLALLLALVFGSFLAYHFRDQVWLEKTLGKGFYRLLQTSLDYRSGSIKSRVLAWQISLRAWQERPILGWGPENYIVAFNANFDPEFFNLEGETWFDRAHNKVLGMAVTSGLAGLLSYLAVFACLIFLLVRDWLKSKRTKWLGPILLCFLLAYFLQNFFVFDTSATYLMFFLILGFVHVVTRKPDQHLRFIKREISGQASPPSRGQTKKNNVLVAALILMMFLVMFKVNFKPALANYHLAMVNYETDRSRALDHFKAAMFMKTPVQTEARQEFVKQLIASVSQLQSQKKPLSPLKPWIELGIGQMKQSLKRFPHNPAPYLYLSRLYNLLAVSGDQSSIAKAEAVLLKAKELFPQRPEIYYELASTYITAGKNDLVKDVYAQLTHATPNLPEVHWRYGLALSLVQEYEKAVAAMEQAQSLGYFLKQERKQDLLILAQTYINADQAEKAPFVYLTYLGYYPDDIQTMSSLAHLFDDLGHIYAAQDFAKKVVEIDPDSRGLVEDLLPD